MRLPMKIGKSSLLILKTWNDEAFTTYQNKLSVLLSAKSKAAIAEAEAKAEEAAAKAAKETARSCSF